MTALAEEYNESRRLQGVQASKHEVEYV